MNLLDHLVIEVGAFYILDRGYLDVACLYRLHQAQEFIMTGATRSFWFRYLDSRSVGRTTGVYSDQTIRLYGFYRKQSYPGHLRRVRYFDADRPKWRLFLSNNFTLPARTLAQPCQCRWQVELFFKGLKQRLRIKALYGTSENAVKTELWIAIAVYTLVAIVKKRLQLEASLYTILQVLSISLFEKIPPAQARTLSRTPALEVDNGNELSLFD